MVDSPISTVGVKELKTRIGTYLKLVRKGARLIVTDRGRPVAELCAYRGESDSPEAVLREMTLLGEATRASTADLEPFTPIVIKAKPLSETIIEDREDRV
jgi:prevent-host-death family protein